MRIVYLAFLYFSLVSCNRNRSSNAETPSNAETLVKEVANEFKLKFTDGIEPVDPRGTKLIRLAIDRDLSIPKQGRDGTLFNWNLVLDKNNNKIDLELDKAKQLAVLKKNGGWFSETYVTYSNGDFDVWATLFLVVSKDSYEAKTKFDIVIKPDYRAYAILHALSKFKSLLADHSSLEASGSMYKKKRDRELPKEISIFCPFDHEKKPALADKKQTYNEKEGMVVDFKIFWSSQIMSTSNKSFFDNKVNEVNVTQNGVRRYYIFYDKIVTGGGDFTLPIGELVNINYHGYYEIYLLDE